MEGYSGRPSEKLGGRTAPNHAHVDIPGPKLCPNAASIKQRTTTHPTGLCFAPQSGLLSSIMLHAHLPTHSPMPASHTDTVCTCASRNTCRALFSGHNLILLTLGLLAPLLSRKISSSSPPPPTSRPALEAVCAPTSKQGRGHQSN